MQKIKLNEATAARRRIFIEIVSDTDGITGWAGSVTGVKAQLSFGGAAEGASTNDIVRVGGRVHYVEITQTEANTGLGPLSVRVASASGRLEGTGYAQIVAYDPYDAVRLGLTAMPNAAADAAGGLPISDAGGLDLDARLDAAISSRASQASVDAVDDFVDTEITDIRNRLPAALVGGRMDASVGAMAAGVVTAAAVATGAIDADALAADAGTEIAAAVLAAAAADPIDANVEQVNTVPIVGDGAGTPFGV